jgi:pilus assembly protein Flp/PilA
MIQRCARTFRQFLGDEHGPTSVEYAVMLALIVLVCIGGIMSLGSNTKTLFVNSTNSIQAAGS